MTEALRRLLWSVPLLLALTVALFFLLSRLGSAQIGLTHPLFYNPNPTSADRTAEAAVADLLNNKEGADLRLVELGGAALPFILGSLAERPLSDKRRIAEALWPLTKRMGYSPEDLWLGSSGQPFTDEEALTSDFKLQFWERFRDDQAVDLNPLSVNRLVKRLATHDAQLRQRELRAADTYALPALVAALGRVTDESDVNRCRRLIKYIAHATQHDFRIDRDATLFEAQTEVTKVRQFWDKTAPQWTERSPFELLTARVVQTEYGTWLIQTLREVTRLDHGRVSENLSQGAKISGPLLIACLVGLVGLGPLISSMITVFLLTFGGYRIERFGLRLFSSVALVTLTTWTLRSDQEDYRRLILLALLTGAAFGTFILQRELSDRLDWRSHQVLRRRGPIARILAVARWIAPTIPTFLPMALAEAVAWVMCLETTTGRPGLGKQTLLALANGDVSFLMAICLTLGVLTMSLQLAADLILGDFDINTVDS